MCPLLWHLLFRGCTSTRSNLKRWSKILIKVVHFNHFFNFSVFCVLWCREKMLEGKNIWELTYAKVFVLLMLQYSPKAHKHIHIYIHRHFFVLLLVKLLSGVKQYLNYCISAPMEYYIYTLYIQDILDTFGLCDTQKELLLLKSLNRSVLFVHLVSFSGLLSQDCE